MPTHSHEDESFCLGLLCLREVKVHLISIEVRVVGGTHALVEAECLVGHHPCLRKMGGKGKEGEEEEEEEEERHNKKGNMKKRDGISSSHSEP